MPPKSLSEFAPELIIHIFESLSSFEDIVSLNSTSHYFFNIWRTNTVSISDAVRPRFECYQDALELLQIQGKVTADAKLVISEEPCEKEELQLIKGLNKLTSSGDRGFHARQAALGLNEAFILNASKIKSACARKLGIGGDREDLRRRSRQTILRGTSLGIPRAKRESLSHAYYRVWILAETKDWEARLLYLESISMEELMDLKDATRLLGKLVNEGNVFGIHKYGWRRAFCDIYSVYEDRSS